MIQPGKIWRNLPSRVKIFLCLTPILCAILALAIYSSHAQTDYMAFLQSLRGADIARIVVYEENNSAVDSNICSVSSPSALDAFARAANQVEPYDPHHNPDHPVDAKKYYIQLYLTNGLKREFEFLRVSDPHAPAPIYKKRVIVWFVHRFSSGFAYYGRVENAAFYDWLEMQTRDSKREPTSK